MKPLEDEIQEIQQSLKRLETAIIGDESMGTKGLVNRVKELEKFKEVAKFYIAIGIGASSVVSTALAFLYNVLVKK